MIKDLYITGAGVSSLSGIPTFRGKDGLWTIGSYNYTPQEMATRKMYLNNPSQFLLWYYKRFIKYRNSIPNEVHYFLSDKNLITQNIDGLDEKAGNKNHITIHGNLKKITKYHYEGSNVKIINAPWNLIEKEYQKDNDDKKLEKILLEAFNISCKTYKPEIMKSLKPYVLLFDEFYTNLYKINKANRWMSEASRIIFIGTSFSVNITSIALRIAINNKTMIEIVDPEPIDLGIRYAKYHRMSALEYIYKCR